MKIKDIAKKFGVDENGFEKYLMQSGITVKEDFWTFDKTIVNGQDINALVENYKQYEREKPLKEKADAEKRVALANMLITSGFNFDGYTIIKYSGYISGDDAVSVDRGMDGIFGSATNVGNSLMASLVTIRRNAIAELKEAAYALGCNAVIGVDFDYLTLDPQTANFGGGTTYLPYVFGVTANGNAVVIEKNKTL
jgi:uncharacterized protein YbjQ (UPF0145 family)